LNAVAIKTGNLRHQGVKNMTNKWVIFGTSICLLSAVGLASAVLSSSSDSKVTPLNQQADIPAAKEVIAQSSAAFPIGQILPQLKGKTQVPIFLPSQVPFSQKVYFNAKGKVDGYTISIDYTANCRGAGACSAGEIRAQKGGEFTQKTEGVTKTLKNIQLANKTQGIFHNGCGAYCTAAAEWKSQGVLYTVAIKNGREADTVKIANSAIEAGAR
jgi:hypothetical protein